MEFEKEEFESIPLPDQGVSLNKQSQSENLSILDQIKQKKTYFVENDNLNINTKSRTIQTLINQNDELSSRLNVSLKRNVELEQRIEELEDSAQRTHKQIQNLNDKNLILSEKSNLLETRIQKYLDEAKNQASKFNELYKAYEEKVLYIQKLSYRLHRFLKYRSKIRSFIKPYISKLKLEIQSYHQLYLNNTEKILSLEKMNLELNQKFENAQDHIKKQIETFESDQAELVKYHESKYEIINDKYHSLCKEFEESEKQLLKVKQESEILKEQEVQLQNTAILYERKYTDLKQIHDESTLKYQSEKDQNILRITTLENHTQQLSSKLTETINYAQNLYNDHKTLNDQYSSLQILFQENLSRIDDYKKRLHSLEQMNKELSQALLEARKKSDYLGEKLLLAEEDFKRKLESLQNRFIKPQEINKPLPQVDQKQLLGKIQNLLSEIQSGSPESRAQKSELISEQGDLGHTNSSISETESLG